MDIQRFPQLIRDIYRAVAELEKMFDRPFTPDGHMVGSIGECLAAYYYGLELLPCSQKDHDATAGQICVQIKATQRNKVLFRGKPDHLLVIKLDCEGSFEEIYNGRGDRVWNKISMKRRQSNGQIPISLSRLRVMMMQVEEGEKLPRLR